MNRKAEFRHILVIVLAPLCWAGNFVLARYVHSEISPVQLNFWRWFLALILLTPMVSGDIERLLSEFRKHRAVLFAQALTGVAVYHCLVYFALKTTTAINATLINSLVPMFIPLFGMLLWRHRIAKIHWLAVGLSTIGVAVVVTKGNLSALLTLRLVTGDIVMIGAAMTWAVYTLLLSKRPASIGGVGFLWCLCLAGSILLAPAYLADVYVSGPFEISVANCVSVAYVAIFAAIVAFLCWNFGATKLSPARLGMFAHLIPVFGSMLAVIFLGESFGWYHAVGVVLIGAGLWVAIANQPKPAAADKTPIEVATRA